MTGRSCCMIRMQYQIPQKSPVRLETLHRHWDFTLFNNSVNHRETSCETIETQHKKKRKKEVYMNGSQPCKGYYSLSRHVPAASLVTTLKTT